jgi:hypothetical protein
MIGPASAEAGHPSAIRFRTYRASIATMHTSSRPERPLCSLLVEHAVADFTAGKPARAARISRSRFAEHRTRFVGGFEDSIVAEEEIAGIESHA